MQNLGSIMAREHTTLRERRKDVFILFLLIPQNKANDTISINLGIHESAVHFGVFPLRLHIGFDLLNAF